MWTAPLRIPAAIRVPVAAVLAAFGLIALVGVFKIPMEAGGLVFGPVLLTATALCLRGAARLLWPPRPVPRRAQPNLRAALGLFGLATVLGVLKLITDLT
jgi:hypothetical protein